MKNIFYLICGCLLTLSSCSMADINEEIVCTQNGEEWVFYASCGDYESRTLLDEQMKNIWCADDRISIFMGNTYNHHYKFDGATGDTSGTFSKVDDPFITGQLLPAHYAIYPYSMENNIDDNGVIYTTLPAIQDYEDDSFGLTANTMVAVTENLDSRFLAFQNVCGYVRLKLYGDNVTLKSVTLAGNDNEILAGDAQIVASYNGAPQLAMDGASDRVLTIDCGEGVTLGTTEYDAASFVFVVPPQVMELGFTIVATDINGNTFTKVSNKKQEIKRNTILSMPALKWVDDNSPKLEIPDGVLTIHNDEKGMLLVNLMDYAYDEIVSMKITGVLNDEDFIWIYYEMPALRFLDLSDVNITTLPKKSFYDSTNVETIILPNTLQTIPDEVFYNSVVKEVYFNDGLQTIGASAFASTELTAIHIPRSVTTIGNCAFDECKKITSITFDDGSLLTNLGSVAFRRTSIESIRIPANVESILTAAASPFYNCSKLKTVTFEDNSKLKVLDKSFGMAANDSSCMLQTIEIPRSVETIVDGALDGTSTLKNVYFESGSSLKTIGNNAFNRTGILAIDIPASVETLGDASFCECSKLETVTFEANNSLTTIQSRAFDNCDKLQSITIPASVETLSSGVFKDCSILSDVNFEANSQLKTICGYRQYSTSYGAFAYCTALSSITIPKSVEEIQIGAFYQSGLTSVIFEEGSQLQTIGGERGDVYTNTNDTYVDVASGMGAFTLTNITEVKLPASLKTIGECAFMGCNSLKKLTFENGSNLTSIGAGAFLSCDITTVKIPAAVTDINEYAFRRNANLKIINFEEGSQLESIDHYAFADCGAMNYFYAQNVTKLRSLGDNVFLGCSDMRLFKIGTVEPSYAWDDSFGEMGTYTVLKVPTESVDAYKSARGWKQFVEISGLDE